MPPTESGICDCFGASGLHASTYFAGTQRCCQLCGRAVPSDATDVLTAVNRALAAEAPQTLVEIMFGAHLYGTATADSDRDYKSVVVPRARDILLQRLPGAQTIGRAKAVGEKNRASDVDREAIPLHQYLRLLSEGQPMALDMLFAPAAAMLDPPSALWTEIVAERHRLISRRSTRFVGYCRTQANKYGIRGSRVHALRRVLAWFDAAIAAHGPQARLHTAADQLPAWIAAERLGHTGVVAIAQPTRPESVLHLQCCDLKTPYFASLSTGRAIFQRRLDGYGARALLAEQNQGIDWKALSHAVRIGHEALELLHTGEIQFPLANAAHLLEIKLGMLPYATVASEIENLLDQVEAAAATSRLPETTDEAYIDDLVCRAYGDAVRAG